MRLAARRSTSLSHFESRSGQRIEVGEDHNGKGVPAHLELGPAILEVEETHDRVQDLGEEKLDECLEVRAEDVFPHAVFFGRDDVRSILRGSRGNWVEPSHLECKRDANTHRGSAAREGLNSRHLQQASSAASIAMSESGRPGAGMCIGTGRLSSPTVTTPAATASPTNGCLPHPPLPHLAALFSRNPRDSKTDSPPELPCR
mgnify:CR=1 FL=1